MNSDQHDDREMEDLDVDKQALDSTYEALKSADSALISLIDFERPARVVRDLERTIGLDSSLHRLAYRPQPTVSNLAVPDHATARFLRMDEIFDLSYMFLVDSANEILPSTDLDKLVNDSARYVGDSTQQGTHFLTRLDAAACLPPSEWPKPVHDTVALLDHLIRGLQNSQDSFWIQDTSVNFRFRILNLKAFMFAYRLMFYKARSQGRSLSTLQADCAQLLEHLHAPKGVPLAGPSNVSPKSMFIPWEECEQLFEVVLQNVRQLGEDFQDVVELEWVGQPIPVEAVSTPIEHLEGMQCIICQGQLTPPSVLTNPCQHAFCRECLEAWIHSCQGGSHKCPSCRTELFPKPTYGPKDSAGRRNYVQEAAELKTWWNRLVMLNHSIDWFREEVKMQHRFEEEIAD